MRLEAGTDWFVIYTLYMYLYLYINTIPEHRTKLLKSTQFVTCNYGDTHSYYIMTRVYGSLVTLLLFIHFSHQFLSNYVPPGMLYSLHWHTSQRCSWDRWTPSQLPLGPYVNCQLVGLFFFTWVTMDTNLHAQLLHFFSNVDRKYPAHIYEVSHGKHRANAKSDFRQKTRPYYS